MKKAYKFPLLDIVWIAFALLLLTSMLTSCKTIQPIPTTDHKDSVRVEYRLDSVYLWKFDSVYVSEKQRNDTIFVESHKWSIRYRDKEVIVHDTINSVQERQIVVTEKYIPKFYKSCTWCFWILLVLIIGIIALRIWLRR